MSAVALLLVVVGFAAWRGVTPLHEAIDLRDEARDRLARYQGMLADAAAPSAATFDPNEIAGAYQDEAEAQLGVQSILSRHLQAQGLAVESLRPTGTEDLGAVGEAAWVEAAFTADLQALTDLLAALDGERPLVLVRALEVEGGGGARPDEALRVRLEAGRAWRRSDAP